MGWMEDKYNSTSWWGKQGIRMPGVASATDAFANMRNQFLTGFGSNKRYEGELRGTPFNIQTKFDYIDVPGENGETIKKKVSLGKAWNPQLSVGGVLTAGGGLLGGAAAGAGIGALAGTFSESGAIAPVAIAGAAIGGVAAVSAPYIAGAAARAGWGAIKNSYKPLAALGGATINGAKSLGNITKGLAGSPLVKGISTSAIGWASKMVKMDQVSFGLGKSTGINAAGKEITLPGVKFSALGKATLIGSTIMGGMKQAASTYMNAHEGIRDNYVTAMSPRINLMDNAGATGDLVFAMNRNRRG